MNCKVLLPTACALLSTGVLAIAACSSSPPAEGTQSVDATDGGGRTADAGSYAATDASARGMVSDATGSDDAGAPTHAALDASEPIEGGDAGAGADRQSLVWIWIDYASALATLAENRSSFTHVSPAFYNLNNDYADGVAELSGTGGADDFDGLTTTQIAAQIKAAGMKCVPLISGGSVTGGVDQGIQNVLGDSPAGTQSAFIAAMTQEAVTKGYDGYDLDWEVGSETTYAAYGADLVAFLGAFKAALAPHGMHLSLIVASWYAEQSNCSGGAGFVDLAAVAPNVDQLIMMDYATTLGTPAPTCAGLGSDAGTGGCAGDFGSSLDLACAYDPVDKISIAFEADPTSGNNAIAGASVAATLGAGIRNVAIWPNYNTSGPNGSYALCDPTAIAPASTTWFALLAGFLAAP